MTFSTNDPFTVSTSATSGQITLLNNGASMDMLTIRAVDSGGVSASATFAANLDPSVGDVDLGSVSGLPIPASSLGSTISVHVRINMGAYSLRAIQLDVSYDSSKLSVASVSTGSQWPGGNFAFNSDAAGLVTFGGACNPVSGLFEMAIVQFTVIGVGVAGISGSVVTMADVNGASIPPGLLFGRQFVAGNVSVVLTGSRRRSVDVAKQMSFSKHAHVRRSGEVSCASPPCQTCSNGRQTGDTNGDCLFDVRDVSYQQGYLNLLVASPLSPLLNVLPIQLINLDTDQNGVVNSQDVDFLLKVNFGLYHFVQSVSVQPVTLANKSCVLSITISLIGGGADVGDQPANSATTFVYFDIESLNSSLSSELSNSVILTGSNTNINKGTGYHGTLFQAQPL